MIDPSFSAVFRSKYTIRRFYISYLAMLAIALLLLIVTQGLLCPGHWISTITKDFLVNLSAALAIFILSYTFYLFVTPPGLRNAEVIPLRDGEISGEIIDRLGDATDYWFWGRSGSYFRAEVLPRLDSVSQEERRKVRIRLVLPDPTAANGKYYKFVRKGLGEEIDDDELLANVIATVVAVAVKSSKNPYLDAEVGFCASVPSLRYDLSNLGALLTRDAKKLPALLTNSGNAYFEMFKDAVENELSQGKRLEWNGDVIANYEILDVKSILAHIPLLKGSSKSAIARARLILENPKHRYA